MSGAKAGAGGTIVPRAESCRNLLDTHGRMPECGKDDDVMKKIFVCSPYRGDIEKNTKRAVFAAKVICSCGDIPIVPHLYFPRFLNENDPYERIRGIEYGIELMKGCDQLWLLGPVISRGMEYELKAAKEICIPVILYDEELRRINPKTLILDERIDDRSLAILKSLDYK